MTTGGAMVIAVGNPYRRDDGVGLAVLERLVGLLPADVRLVEESGEPTALVTRWAGAGLVVLVDAISAGSPAGTLHRLQCLAGQWDVPPPAAAASTHGLGIAEAVALAEVLGRLPQRLVLLGVEVADVGAGQGLSPQVQASVDVVVAGVLGELGLR